MKKKLSIVIILLIIIVISSIVIIKLTYDKNSSNTLDENNVTEHEEELDYSIPLITNLTKIESEYYFQNVKNTIDQYYEYLKKNDSKAIKGLIDTKYKDKYKEDINKNIISKDSYIDIVNIYMNEQSNDLSTYVVEVNILNKKTGKSVEDKIIIRMDLANISFSVIPFEYITDNNQILEGKPFTASTESIKQNNYNKMEVINGASYYVLTEYYYNKIKNLSLYNVEKAYDMLKDDYKKENCKTLDEYKKLVKELFNVDSEVTQYKRRLNSDGDITIMCKDNKENEFVIVVDYAKDGLTKFEFYKK